MARSLMLLRIRYKLNSFSQSFMVRFGFPVVTKAVASEGPFHAQFCSSGSSHKKKSVIYFQDVLNGITSNMIASVVTRIRNYGRNILIALVEQHSEGFSCWRTFRECIFSREASDFHATNHFLSRELCFYRPQDWHSHSKQRKQNR